MNSSSSKPNKPRQPRMNWQQRLLLPVASVLVAGIMWFVRLTSRVTVVQGREQIDRAQAEGGVMIPCSWHQRLLVSGIFLAKTLPRGMRAGFLISPSREGEFISRVASYHGTTPVRGSSSHKGGSEALQSTLAAMDAGISPMMYGDGPRGPAGVFKRGGVVLAKRSGKPMMIMGVAMSRYWQINSWDKTMIPKPFGHFVVAIDDLWWVPEDTSPEEVDQIALQVGEKIDAMTELAEGAL